MSIDQQTTLPRGASKSGERPFPSTVEEVRARADEIARGRDALDEMGDAEEQQ